jgi:glycosyltransferase involved in cell wall biosynthesis
MRLSVVVITKDEERDLPDCLESVKPLDPEIVVLDSGSNDSTRRIAREYGAKVSSRLFDDFASQKQAAIEMATGDWILSLDADERLTPELAEEIAGALDGTADAYDIPYEVWFLGSRLRFGGLGSEHHVRLFRRGRGRFGSPRLHEGVEVSGTVGRLRSRIRHVPYRDLNEYLEKMVLYTDRAALKRYERGKRFTPLYHLLPFWEFFMRTVLKGGVLDGFPGILWAGLSSFHTWLKYAKLRELERNGT